MRIILSSSSPRIKKLLQKIWLNPQTLKPFIEEAVLPDESLIEFAQRISLEKAEAVYQEKFFADLVISSDTIINFNNTLIGKPDSPEDAYKILKVLSGRTHEVISGLVLFHRGEKYVDYSCTKVRFENLTDTEINAYLKGGDYADKAGAYGIQGKASIFVKGIEGCYFNVMGFPLNLFYTMVKQIGIAEEVVWSK